MTKINLRLDDKAIALQETLLIINDAIEHIRHGHDYFDRVLAPAVFSLVVKTNSNHPLLIDMAKEHDVSLDVEFDNPPPRGIVVVNFESWMDEMYWASGTHQEKMTRKEFLKNFRDKRSVAHQDPNVTSEMYHSSSMDGYGVGGISAEAYGLLSIAEVVSMLGERVLRRLEPQG